MLVLADTGALRYRAVSKFKPVAIAPRRYNILKGGRGSGKSHSIAEKLVADAYSMHTRTSCMREIQNSIKDSSKQLIEDKIRDAGLEHAFKITDREIVCPHTESLFIFRGLQNHTAATIKSLEGFNRAWYEEAQSLSAKSIELATPTFRRGAQQYFSYNPDEPEDPIEDFEKSGVGDPDFHIIEMNWRDNPFWFDTIEYGPGAGLEGDRLRDKRRDMDKYLHVWEGHHRKNSNARVFKNVTSYHFETPKDAYFYQGADWGFSVDPTVLVRLFTGFIGNNGDPVYDPDGKTLFIDYEAYEIGCEIDNTPTLFDRLDPLNQQSARRWETRADSARPETISYMQKHGYPLMVKARKGPNSVIDGISFLQNYDIVVHPRCKHTWDEFIYYSYKIDPKTHKVTNELADKDNHVIDAVRYAVEELRRPSFKWHVS